MLSHYDVLGVEPTADVATIRRAWRVKVRLLHPDKHRGAPDDVLAEAERETLRVNRAWETLADPARRRQYDAQLARRRDTETRNGKPKPSSRPNEEAGDVVAVACSVCNATQHVGRSDGRFRCVNCKMAWEFAKCEECQSIVQVAQHRRTWRCERCGRQQPSSWPRGTWYVFCVRCKTPTHVAPEMTRFACTGCGLDHVCCHRCGEYTTVDTSPWRRWRCIGCGERNRLSRQSPLDLAQHFAFLFAAVCCAALGLLLMARLL
ncbi:MAG: J domain-containing protein [Acidimicrobiia bacterium]